MANIPAIPAVVPFGVRLREALDTRGPVCVGIDPHASLLRDWGLDDTPEGLRSFSFAVLEAVTGEVNSIKPQSAFFERHGSRGIAVLEDLLAAARERDVLTILDVKRGDIGSTMQGYAEAYLLPGAPLEADAITLTPYLGFGALAEAMALASANGKGTFVLALTSNPEGRSIQHAQSAAGVSVAAEVVREAQRSNAAEMLKCGSDLGSLGLVIGATIGSAARDLGIDLAASGAPLLAPGIGAQGAGEAEVRDVFGNALGNVVASVSRGVLRAGPSVATLRDAARRVTDDMSQAVSA
ncbi:orotidine-5'-phosphate decarboxylase [Micrococcales bacterium 31B]|nr:orotidine-5'-phosphate decarboxylase [Micrococcales bacterium 31B]